MPDKDEPASPEPNSPLSVRAGVLARVYANNAQVEMSVWDLRITFGEFLRVGKEIRVEQSVSVTMSPQHAKALLRVLSTNLSEYESRFGEINLPPDPDSPTPTSKR